MKAFDSAADVGGTWYWNRYPGARFDSEGYIYQYLFSEELYKEWSWSEKFPGQPEIERWLQWVADRLDLRKDIVFNTRIASAQYNEVDRSLDRHDRQGRNHRRAVPGHLLRHALGAADVRFPRTGYVQGPAHLHREMAEGAGRSRRQAGRRRRHRRDRDPGHPDDRGQGRLDDRVRAHAAVCAADEEPEIHAG